MSSKWKTYTPVLAMFGVLEVVLVSGPLSLRSLWPAPLWRVLDLWGQILPWNCWWKSFTSSNMWILPSWELIYIPYQGSLADDFPFWRWDILESSINGSCSILVQVFWTIRVPRFEIWNRRLDPVWDLNQCPGINLEQSGSLQIMIDLRHHQIFFLNWKELEEQTSS